jgi:CHAT domain-containing protein
MKNCTPKICSPILTGLNQYPIILNVSSVPTKIILFIIGFGLSLSSLQAQSVSEHYLHNRIEYFNNNLNIPAKFALTELESYLTNINMCSYKNDSTHVFLLRKIATEYWRMGDNLTAVSFERRALGIMNSNIGKTSVNPTDLINIYYYLSIFYDALNYAKEKRAAEDSCISIAIRLKSFSNVGYVQLLRTKVQFYYDIGDYHRCIDDAIACENLSGEYIGSSIPETRDFGIYLASNSLGWHVKSLLELNDYGEAERLIANKLEQYRKEGLIDYLGLIYEQKAQLEMHKGNYQNALLFLERSLYYDQKAGNNLNCKQTLKDIGYKIFYEHFKDYDGSLVYYKKALFYTGKDKREKYKDAIESLDIFANIANVYVRKAMYDSAFWYFQLAFNQIRSGTNETDILHSSPEKLIEIRKIHYLTNLMIGKGDAYLQKYLSTNDTQDLRKSIHIYKVTDSVFDRIKLEQIEMESKLFWRKNSRRMYEHAINACYMSGDVEEAFYFFEKSRAVILNDLLAEQNWQTDHDIRELSQATKRLMMLERDIQSKSNSSDMVSALQKDILNERYQLDQLQQTIKKKKPLYYQSFLDPNRTTLNDIGKKILNDHRALLELFEGDSAVYSLLITGKHTYLNKIDKEEFDILARVYNSFLSNPDLLNAKMSKFASTAHNLYEMIFKNNEVPKGRIIISPDGAYFPFESLVTDSTNPDAPVYFLQEHAVSYTYSARYLMNDFSNKDNKSNGSVLGMAPVHYAYAAFLNPLIGSDLSLNQVDSYFKVAHALVEEKASKNNFLQQYSKYSVIQLYTHASDSSDRNEPVIYFSDSSLYLSDLIQENKPSTQLIVLSACNTGNGKLYPGEGIFSFNRAFATVGVPASVINLWSIESKSTYRITELFYKYLSLGMTTDNALQSAKLEFIRTSNGKHLSPYYWAAAILVGKSDTILLEKAISWKMPALLAILAGLSFFLVLNWMSKKRKMVRIANP